ncbi:hemophore-related protein [Tsukamurella ocularis]|uniref:hemophore-related protein n=1 Tax=Tsukamurella ocularis TaxID=1970234 RepID=UPI00216A0F4D|nr:hemophore-related protein [Tsukamurella ocularis]MCS3782420.1 hemophore-related protein [Tsukamurella ocularis]MCS3789825.1 hemophore-related protein [Tsukamurella ocularis]MCS3853210.1 hemophore-related protein [Tsukamurella ocularis]
MNRIRIAAAVAALAGALAVVPAVASAAPTDKVPGTKCTVAQVERATQVIAPEAIAVMDATPGGRDQATELLTAKPEDRQAIIERLTKDNPAAAAYYRANRTDIDAKIAKVIATCDKY